MSRKKGLIFCREVKKILEGIGHVVDGPFFKSKFFNERVNPVHTDIFKIFDLVSYFEGCYFMHQVSTLSNKADKVKSILEKKMTGWVWARVSNGKVFYRIFVVKIDGIIEEVEVKWKC